MSGCLEKFGCWDVGRFGPPIARSTADGSADNGDDNNNDDSNDDDNNNQNKNNSKIRIVVITIR